VSEFVVAGGIHSALAHFALVGLAGIVDHASDPADARCRIFWTDDATPRPVVTCSLDDDARVAEAVRQHALRHRSPHSWVSQRVSGGSRDGSGLFTARAKAPTLDEWPAYLRARRDARERMGSAEKGERPDEGLDTLDKRLLLALGEAAWWRCDAKEARPDDGASRWEMKTRNQGQEFIVHRLSPLADAVAARSSGAVLAGLTGQRVVDETGKNSPTSRTSTGLTTPGPVDSAMAWCALWGLHAAPTIHRKAGVSKSPGVWPRHRVHPSTAVLPVFTRPTTVLRFHHVLVSQPFDLAGARTAAREADTAANQIKVLAARRWLRDQGVTAMVRFPVLKTGSTSAPERQLLTGEVLVV
jgi:CRISPR-associated protein Csb3